MSEFNSALLSYLDQIPDIIYQRLVTHQYRSSIVCSQSCLQQRATGILEIRQYLLQGKAISREALQEWLNLNLLDRFYQKLSDNELLSNTLDNESYTDEVLLLLLNWLDNLNDDISYQKNIELPDDNHFNIQHDQSTKATDAILKNDLQKLNNLIRDIDKGFMVERYLGWDLSRGIKSTTDLNLLIQTHHTIKDNPQLQSIINLIGRNCLSSFDRQEEAGLTFTQSHSSVNNQIPDENAINSVTGVHSGDDVSRMLSSEMAMLGHKRFKMLWYARRAERQLLNYHYKGLLSEHVPNIQQLSIDQHVYGAHSIKMQGPMILCVDTSASMKGRPALLSKAIALEVMRTALKQNRACYLFCFSGQDEVVEFELNLNCGWETILQFLNLSFNGGTDINAVLIHATRKLKTKQWKDADLLLVSDGRFKIQKNVIEETHKIQSEVRFFGIQTGQWSSDAFSGVCHKVFDLSHAI
jgi:uncharacterized protein with von Willebrand factor type A (vWA) domain